MNKNNGWFKCSEELPESPQKVFVYTQSGEIFFSVYVEKWGFLYVPSFVTITHWQPLVLLPPVD